MFSNVGCSYPFVKHLHGFCLLPNVPQSSCFLLVLHYGFTYLSKYVITTFVSAVTLLVCGADHSFNFSTLFWKLASVITNSFMQMKLLIKWASVS